MAQNPPQPVDVTSIQFKLQNKGDVFASSGAVPNNCSLLASACNHGLLFMGVAILPELRAVRLSTFVDSKPTDAIPVRSVPLSGIPHAVAVSCDHSMVAVNYVSNGASLIDIYSVASFYSTNIQMIFQGIRISPNANVRASQILWNPVVPNSFAVCLDDGTFGVYNLKDKSFEFHQLDKNEQAQSACWSPKGKQIVVGFANGKLMQFKPDLKPAKTIACPAGIFEAPFSVIAIQWLSTYQFAAVFLAQSEEACPALHIINTSKTAPTIYINYMDICYSQSGPRKAQVFLTHILQWNILLMATSNSMEVGVLGTNENSDTPLWTQYVAADEARAELPLTKNKSETFPIGFALETGTTHQLVIAEQQIPVMPMIFILSTHGCLLGFNFLNFNNAPGICSPPKPCHDQSGLNQYQPFQNAASQQSPSTPPRQQPQQQLGNPMPSMMPPSTLPQPALQQFGASMPLSMVTQQPAKPQPLQPQPQPQLFQPQIPTIQPQQQSPFQQQSLFFQPQNTAPQTDFNLSLQQGITSTPIAVKAQSTFTKPIASQATPKVGTNLFGAVAPTTGKNTSFIASAPAIKPLITVPPTYPAETPKIVDEVKTSIPQKAASNVDNATEKAIMKDEIETFSRELSELLVRSKKINIEIGTRLESAAILKSVSDSEELMTTATETAESMANEVHSLQMTLLDSYAMVSDAESQLEAFKVPDVKQLRDNVSLSQTSRRQMTRLESMLEMNQKMFQCICNHLDAQWSDYQDLVKKNNTAKTHVPSLEGVYMTINKLFEIMKVQKGKLASIKSQLGVQKVRKQVQRGQDKNESVRSVTDSLISMTLVDKISCDETEVPSNKMQIIKNAIKNRPVSVIRPKRPERTDISSEVIIEKRIIEKKRLLAAEKNRQQSSDIETTKPIVIKPTASKPIQTTLSQKMSDVPSKPFGFQKTDANKPTKPTVSQSMAVPPTTPFGFKKTDTSILFGNSMITSTPMPAAAAPAGMFKPHSDGKPFASFDNVAAKSKDLPKPNIQPPSKDAIPPIGFPFGAQPMSSFAPSSSGSLFAGISKDSTKNILPDLTRTQPVAENKPIMFGNSAPMLVKEAPKTFGTASLPSGGSFFSGLSKEIIVTPISPGNSTSSPFNVQPTESSSFSFNTLASKKDGDKENKSSPAAPSLFGTGFGLQPSRSTANIFSKNDQNTSPPNSTMNAAPLQDNSIVFGKPSKFGSESQKTVTSSISFSMNSPTASFGTSAPPVSALTSTSSPTTIPSNLPSALVITPIKPVVSSTATPIASSVPSPASTFSFISESTGISFGSPAQPVATATSSFLPTTTSPSVVTAISAPTATTIETENLLQGLNVCKPVAFGSTPVSTTAASGGLFSKPSFSTADTSGSSIFSGSSFKAPETTASIFGSPSVFGTLSTSIGVSPSTTPGTTSSTPTVAFGTSGSATGFGSPVSAISFGSTAGFGATASTPEVLPPSTTVVTSTPAPVTSFGQLTSTPSAVPTSAIISPVASTITPIASFGTLASTPGVIAATTTASGISTAAPTTVFGTSVNSTPFGSPAPPATSITPSFGSPTAFGSPVTAATTSVGLFGTAPAASTTTTGNLSQFGTTTSTTASSLFGSAASSMFGASPQQVAPTGPPPSFFSTSLGGAVPAIGATPSSTFGVAATPSGTNVFGSPQQPAATTASVFGSSMFGGGAAASPFGGAMSTPFGQQAAAPTGGVSTFGTPSSTAASIFGGAAAASNTTSGGSIFGGSSFGSPSTGTSMFGGGSATGAGGSTAFGVPAPSAFGNTFGGGVATSGFGTPGVSPFQSNDGQQSVSQSGFGSPSAFGGGGVGAPGGFGSPPAFGTQTAFGATPSFGSPKGTGFGTFANVAPVQTNFAQAPQRSSFFESLGTADTGVSFGNLAQTGNNQQKSNFGGGGDSGGSFSSWR